jgi:hypothetical protein
MANQTNKADTQLEDFDLPVQYSPDKLADKLVAKEGEYKSRFTTKQAKGVRPSWFFVVALFLITIALAGFVYQSSSQLTNLKSQLSDLQTVQDQTFSNSSQQLIYSPVTAFGFTILPQLRPPQAFESNREQLVSSFFPGRESVKSSFLYTTNSLRSGISVEVTEYDNISNLDEFAELVATTLGEQYSSSQNTILLPDSIQLMKINSDQENIDFYVSVTTENYYFLTIYKQTKDIPEAEEVNQFTNTILGSLYLN